MGYQRRAVRRCALDGCDNTNIAAKGLCWKHYRRLLRHGDPLTIIIERNHSPICEVEGCELPHNSHGFCDYHARRYRQTGSPVSHVVRWDGDVATLPDYVEVEPETACWLWHGAQPGASPGETFHSPRVTLDGRVQYVHRIVAANVHGAGPDDLVTRECRNKYCVNPDHLRVHQAVSA